MLAGTLLERVAKIEARIFKNHGEVTSNMTSYDLGNDPNLSQQSPQGKDLQGISSRIAIAATVASRRAATAYQCS